jgi:flavin reductase (DIM6/NTAB) family NADH-FMN oxidoreductase RutF
MADADPEAVTPPFNARDFRDALGCFPTGVTVVTAAAADGRLAGLTVNSFSSVSLNPPLVLWSLFLHSPSMPIFQEATHFCVNVLSAEQAELARHFAKHSDDKFAGINWHPGLGGAPMLEGTIAQFQCRNSDRHYGGDHVIFLGAVERYTYRSGDPLLFTCGAYRTFSSLV